MLTADQHEMVRKDFVWDRDKWTKDYDAKLESLKQGPQPLCTSPTIVFSGISAATHPIKPAEVLFYKELQVIAFVSTKFSGSAASWPTNKKECYSLYYSVKELSYYL
jgi:hypothetical protein